MSKPTENLLIDIGNSRIKYALVNNLKQPLDVHFIEQHDTLVKLIQSVDRVLLSSVGHQNQVDDIKILCEQANVVFYQAKTEPVRFGVHCAYENYQNLGVDRWLAILAARALTSLPVAVFDLGTASTCDIVTGNYHQGGWIAPGFDVMRSALIKNTTHVFSDASIPNSLSFGGDTPECVNMGCLASIQGLILSAEKMLQSQFEHYQVIITGGNQTLISDMANQNWSFQDNLVLKGLSLFVQP